MGKGAGLKADEGTVWCFTGNRISVRFEYEWHDESGQWFRTHGNEHWEFG
jgi:nuclear transport factor 2 (NTF2) superfamily protein